MNDSVTNLPPGHSRRSFVTPDLRYLGSAVMGIAEIPTGYRPDVVHDETVEMKVVSQNLGNLTQRPIAGTGR